MKVHIISDGLILLEYLPGYEPHREELKNTVSGLLKENGLTQWPSLEAEIYSTEAGSLIFLSPVRVYIPAYFKMLLEDR